MKFLFMRGFAGVLAASVLSIALYIDQEDMDKADNAALTLFLCGDVMTGRGVDQAYPVSVDPQIYESYVTDARGYLRLAEAANGNIPDPVSYDYIWGDALSVWREKNPALKIINLETSVTNHDKPWPGKGINYRMHPDNVKTLLAADIHFCSLANNHTLDWNREGLMETLQTLDDAGIARAGAGEDWTSATRPAVLNAGGDQHIIVVACGTGSSGIPYTWKAAKEESGLYLLHDLDGKALQEITRQIRTVEEPGDIAIVSIHWGGNWGYEVPEEHRSFAHRLIDEAGVDIVHGHSSHHPRGVEVYKDKLIIYGAGDFINDYEGISGHERYRGDLTLMYFPEVDSASGKLIRLVMVPLQIRNFRLNRASSADAQWLQKTLHRESRRLGAGVTRNEKNELELIWSNQ